MRKRYITLSCTQAETEYRLRQLLRVYFPKGIVEENYFRVYYQTSGFFMGKSMQKPLFCFFGNYQQSGNKTYISYRVLPNIPILLSYLFLSYGSLSVFHSILFEKEPIFPSILLFGFLLFYCLITQVLKRKCIIDFEKRVATEVRYESRR